MLVSFIYVGREALEMMFLLFMITATISLNRPMITAGTIGILSGFLGGFLIGDLLEDYEVLMYAMLSALMLWLFFTSQNLPAHIKGHVLAIANNTASKWTAMFTIWFIFFRESMEIFLFMFSPSHPSEHTIMMNPHWIGAGLAVVLVASLYKVLEKFKHTRELFTITRYAFLVFAVCFGYEALEHANLL